MAVFQATFFFAVTSHVTGGLPLPTPAALRPRNDGQFCASAGDAASAKTSADPAMACVLDVMASSIVRRRTDVNE